LISPIDSVRLAEPATQGLFVTHTKSTVWAPLITSASVVSDAWVAIEGVAHASVHDDYDQRRRRDEDHALFYAYLAAARCDESWAVRATERLNATIDRAASEHPRLALYAGLCGLGWTVEHVPRLLDAAFPSTPEDDGESAGDHEEDVDLNADIDAAVVRELRQVTPGTWLRYSDYDLISGLVGYGTYFLERWPLETAKAGVRLVIDHLAAIAERTDRGVTWHTPPELLPDWQRLQCPAGYYNLGVAHGMPGVIHFLSEAAAAGVEHDDVDHLLNGAVDWLVAQRRPAGSGSWFSGWLASGQSRESRLTWCYGDLGILSVLFQVARRTHREDLRRVASDLLDHCLVRPLEDCGIQDAELCHGAAGVAHIFNRLYQAEGDLRCRDAALAWFDRALAMRQPTTSAAGGFLAATRPDPTGPTIWEPSAAFLDGAIGVALALLSAVTPIEPSWDRLMLISGRNWA
jgi:hypothetical protein